jgi:hypothetical protein
MKKLIALALIGTVGLVPMGCRLPVPKTSIAFDPKTKTVKISSPKDVKIGGVALSASATNFSLTITNYESLNSIEVVKAAAEAQGKQIAAGQETFNKIVSAAVSGAK